MYIQEAHGLGEIVYLKTDPEQRPRIVTAIKIEPNGLKYLLGFGAIDSIHEALEITKEKTLLEITPDIESNA